MMASRYVLYTAARTRTPARWSGVTHNCSPITTVRLNPEHDRTDNSRHIAV